MSEYLRSELIRLASRPTQDELFARIESRRGELPPGEAARTIRQQRGALPAEGTVCVGDVQPFADPRPGARTAGGKQLPPVPGPLLPGMR